MAQSLRRKLNYSNVVATMALFVALGGSAAAVMLPKNSVGPKQLKRGAVTAKALRKGAVTSRKIAPKAVTNGKLGPDAVGPGNIGNGAVTAAKLSTRSVTGKAIAPGAVDTGKLGNGAVTTGKLDGGAVTSAKLDGSAVTTGKIENGAVTLAKLGNEVAPLLGTLRSGQTLRGFFDLGASSTMVDQMLSDSYTFQFPLLKAPVSVGIVDLTLPETVSPECPGINGGNQETPEAAPGILCVYITGKSNLKSLVSLNGPTRLGFGLRLTSAAGSGEFEAVGQWAVTAP